MATTCNLPTSTGYFDILGQEIYFGDYVHYLSHIYHINANDETGLYLNKKGNLIQDSNYKLLFSKSIKLTQTQIKLYKKLK